MRNAEWGIPNDPSPLRILTALCCPRTASCAAISRKVRSPTWEPDAAPGCGAPGHPRLGLHPAPPSAAPRREARQFLRAVCHPDVRRLVSPLSALMKQITQNFRSGELALQEVPAPCRIEGGVLVRNAF